MYARLSRSHHHQLFCPCFYCIVCYRMFQFVAGIKGKNRRREQSSWRNRVISSHTYRG